VNATNARPLRYRLFLLAASGLVPLALAALVVLSYVTRERKADTELAALEVSRALATAVDAELRATRGVLQSLAVADELRPLRLEPFQALARRVAESQGWRAVVLADASGNILMNTSVRLDAVDPRPVEPRSMAEVLRSREPVVGRVANGANQAGPAFAVRVPVLRVDRVDYVLSAVLPTERILNVVTRQNVPGNWVVGIFDQDYNRVARSRDHVSRKPSPTLQRLLDTGAPEGHGPTYTLEGVESHTAYTRLPSGWVVAIGISAAEAQRGLAGVLGAVAAGFLASLALSAFLAWYFARGVTQPIDSLKRAAESLGQGEPVTVPSPGIAELRDVAAALEHASRERDRAAAERQRASAEREALLARVTEALRQAEEAGRSKDEFLAMLGHELRNPLAPMITAMHLMARKGDDRTKLEREVMGRQLDHMKRLVDDLLDVSRITGQRLTIRREPLLVAQVVKHAAQSVQPVLGLRRFRLEIAPGADALWVSGDEVRLGQVLNNLLGNAVKFTGPEQSITLALRQAGDDAEITVADDGVGMQPEVLERVFELFYQAPQGADRSRGGLGLGLAIVRSLVEMHGGMVRAQSAGEGRGSVFVLLLPAIPAPRREVPPAEGTPSAAEGARGRVLVVDDNRDAADTAASLLQLSGYEVQVAYDPGVALALLDRFAPDIALLDIGLPGMSGYELAGRMREHPHGKGCMLVALTGYGTQADVAQARAAGFDHHLVKPAAPEDLLGVVARACDPGWKSM
jgi:signal transduction histidine kinase/CheY-like chemotaxis protein